MQPKSIKCACLTQLIAELDDDVKDVLMIDAEPVAALAQRAQQQYQSTTRAVIVSWNLHYLQSGQLMRGYEQFFIDLMIDKNMAHAILQKLHQVYLQRIETFLRAFSDFFDVVFLTDDLGTQQSGLISPATYKEMIFPYISEIIARIKSYKKKIIMHSCGAVSDFIPFHAGSQYSI